MGGVRPSQFICKVRGLIDVIVNHPISNGSLRHSMPIIMCPVFKEGQRELEDW